MKLSNVVHAAIFFLALSVPAAQGKRLRTSSKTSDRTITQVVKLLQSMLDKSKADGDSERSLYAKFKCYCDDNEAAKKQEIEQLTETIGLLENDIEELQASSSVLSKEAAQLKKDMADNVDARAKADGIRSGQATEFAAFEADMTDSISRLTDAIKVLAEIAADQTMGEAAADHEYFMGKQAELLKLKTTVRQALVAASSIVSKRQTSSVEAFLQAPFTGTYTAQSGEVVGILKDMKDTFMSNLKDATEKEKAAIAAHAAYTEAMLKQYDEMDKSLTSKLSALSTNDSTLAAKRTQLTDAESAKAEAETFLEQLLVMCSDKAKQYETRVLLRTNEEAAIAEAIAILNSDAAFDLFGKVTATHSGPTSFLQYDRHGKASGDKRRREAQMVLQKAAFSKGSHGSVFLTKVLALLEANNPFAVVLEEIDKMIALLAAEETADDDQLDWCNSERTAKGAALTKKEGEIITLKGEIGTLNTTIEHPQTGLKAMLQSNEDLLDSNLVNQKTQTEERTENNLAYQKDIANLVEAEALLTKAIAVLEAYYSKIIPQGGEVFLSMKQPTPPSTWDGDYKGQSAHGGTDAIGMLKFILDNTKKEETAAHDEEKVAQHDFEDNMQQLKQEQETLEQTIASLKLTLAQKEEELLGKIKDLKATVAEKLAIEAYLLKIKPGCDFITDNIAQRKASRSEEKAALETAMNLLKDTPVYKDAVAAAHNETLGECLEICAGNEPHVNCKACLAHVTVPAYCAGHPGTAGC